jgi:DNA-directed RNA polymerase subunit beta'
VIVGRLIPAGTGGAIARLRQVAVERDRVIQAEQTKAQQPVAAIEGPPQQAAE